jgi:hypothetical protein
VAEAKPFASLSSGLLARKGAARPAMRPQGFGQGVAGLEDLGWNDMGFEPPKPASIPAPDETHDAFGDDVVEHPRAHPTGLTPVQSPVHHQQAELADRFGVDEGDEEVDEAFDETAELYDGESEAVEPETPAVEAFEAFEAFEAPVPAPAPRVAAPVVSVARRAPRSRSAPGSKGKSAFTLRLDPDRHLRLRLACAVGGRSAQQLVTDALDQLLELIPELDAMAAKAKPKG